MTDLGSLDTPAAIVDRDVVVANCARMRAFAARRGVTLRPHVKTHKCVPAAQLALGAATGPITVSTLAEAEHFAAAGFDDITYAVPIALSRVERALELAERVTLSLLVDHADAARALGRAAAARAARARVLIKVDCGYHRAGVEPHRPEARALAAQIADDPALELVGLLTHAGHSYACRDVAGIAAVAREERAAVVTLAEALVATGIPIRTVSVGSTPTMSVEPALDGVTEIRPGNYVFFDAFQAAIGSCSLKDAAFSVLTSVIGSFPHDGRLIVDAGALALSKDRGADHLGAGREGYGAIAALDGTLLPELTLASLSQEHGVVRGAAEPIARHPIGTRLRVIANHSCLAAACHPHYEVVRGEAIVERWTPTRAW